MSTRTNSLVSDKPPAVKCPGCGYSHRSGSHYCDLCIKKGLETLSAPVRIAVPAAVPASRDVPAADSQPPLDSAAPALMPHCQICEHPQRGAIDAALRDGRLTLSELSSTYGRYRGAFSRHKLRCLKLPRMDKAASGRKGWTASRRERVAAAAQTRPHPPERAPRWQDFHRRVQTHVEVLAHQITRLLAEREALTTRLAHKQQQLRLLTEFLGVERDVS